MRADHALQSLWDWVLGHVGVTGVASPAFLLTAVVAGVYLPGIVFSFVDVVISKRLTLTECWAVYWRAMKWYGSLYVVAMVVFWTVPMTLLSHVPATAPMPFELCRDVLMYFLLGDFVSYFWHRFEHRNRRYMKNVHYYHHVDTPPLTIWTAMVVHPVEGFSVFACFHSYGILFPIHPLIYAIGAFSVTAVNMITPCGYRLRVYDWFFATWREHDIHHASREPRNVSVICVFDLSREEEDGLIHMRLEEKVARDVYIFLGDFYNRKLFTNISESEQIHMDKMLALLIKYDVEDPASNEGGVFYQPEFQQLYDAFILQGQTSYSEALLVGKAIEELDISDLGFQLTFVDNPDIVNVYTNLLAASQNHLATFLNHINTDTPNLPSTE